MNDQTAKLDAELIQALKERGLRVTLPRLAVHRQVRSGAQHVTVEQLHAQLAPDTPSLSPATIYTTLELLEELGLVRRVSTTGGVGVFDSRTDRHHHAICRVCGRVEDVEGGQPSTALMEKAKAAGFHVEHAEVQLSGRCFRCATSER